MLSTDLHTSINLALPNGNFARHTLSHWCCVFPLMQGETLIVVRSLCLSSSQGASIECWYRVRDSLTEKRRDSHIFREPEIHYTVTRTTGTVMVSMLEI